MIKLRRIYATDYGNFDEGDLPTELQARLATARFRKDKLPDKRSSASVRAWADLLVWARQEWEYGDDA